MSMNDERVLLTDEQAEAMLPDGDAIHTFQQSMTSGVLIGCDLPRARVLEMIRNGQPELSGETATRMGHGLAVSTGSGHVFVATKKQAAPLGASRFEEQIDEPRPG